MNNQSLNIHLSNFNGPLELLLHLINNSKMNIYDIQINKITDQYMLYLETLKSLNINSISDYFVMATELMEIKSKMLLPKSNIDTSNNDPRTHLVNKLTTYKYYLKASNELKKLSTNRKKLYTRPPVVPNSRNDLLNIGKQVDVKILSKTFNDIINMKMNHAPLEHDIFKWKYSESDQVKLIKQYLYNFKSVNFYKFFSYKMNLEKLITNFLAILNMIKQNMVIVYQKNNEIILQLN